MAVQETKLVNAFETTLVGSVASGATTSIALTDDPGITSDVYLVVDPDNDSKREVVLWTSGAYNAMVWTRDVDSKHGTDPAHAAGTTVRLAVVKQHIEDLHDRVDAVALTGPVTGTLAAGTSAIATTIAASTITGQTDLASGLALTDEILISDAGTLKKGDIALIADAIDGAGIDASAGTLVNAAIGKQSIWVPATAMYPTNTGGCAAIALTETTAGRPDMYTLDFDASSDENAQFSVAFPSYWNEGTITYQAYWTTTATDTDGVAWSLAGVAVSDNDTIDVAFGTAVVVTDDALGAAEDLMVTAESGAVTIAGSPAAGDLCYFNIERDVSDANDDMAEDAKLIGIKLFYTVDDVHEA